MKITPRKYACALLEALEEAKKPHDIIRNFLVLLWKRKQFRVLPKILMIFEEEWNRRNRVVKCTAWHPGKFAYELENLQASIAKTLKRNVIMIPAVDNSLIGGFKLRFDDVLVDASVAGQLQRLKQQLLN